MAYRLKNEGYPWQVIYNGRSKVGRVYASEGAFIGKIGSLERVGRTMVEAFRNVAMADQGCNSAHEYTQRKAAIRQQNSIARERAQYAASELFRGNIKPLEGLISESRKTR